MKVLSLHLHLFKVISKNSDNPAYSLYYYPKIHYTFSFTMLRNQLRITNPKQTSLPFLDLPLD